MSGARVVAMGGGHGLAQVLTALRGIGVAPTAVVTTADDGGSSGRLREELGIIAPGDLRRALLALAADRDLAVALAHRFGRGQLAGHAVGNLLLVALAEQAGGDFVAALDRAGRLLRCRGRVLPSTTEPVVLRASVAGHEVTGQVRLTEIHGHIERVWLDPEPTATAAAVKAVREADVVILGPGSLYTSVVANLCVPGLRDALVETAATVVQVANLRTQTGETEGLDAAGHVEALVRHAPGLIVDVVLLHDGPLPAGQGRPLGTDLEHPAVRRALTANLVGDGGPGALSHDPQRLGAALAGLLGRQHTRDAALLRSARGRE